MKESTRNRKVVYKTNPEGMESFHKEIWIDFEEWCKATGKEVYMCMVCKKKFAEGHLPTLDEGNQRGDGCCTIGSLIEIKHEGNKAADGGE